MEPAITIKNLRHSYQGTEIFRDFNLKIEQAKITALFGPNGSGKSTLLNILSGVAVQNHGVCHVADFKRFRFSYIFQNYRDSLLPWRTNFENVALPLQIQGWSRQLIKKKIFALQTLLDIDVEWQGFPYELSGGQQQLLVFLRALVIDPVLLFIDEPFSALDYENNLLLRDRLQKYFLAYTPTIILVTHNIEEAVHLADTIVVLSKKPTSVLEQIKNPLPRPRTVDSLKTADFHSVKDRVLSVFQQAIEPP